MDKLSKERRSALMAKVRGANTAPELVVRRILWRLGYRFRLHVRKLPGSPDIVLPRYRTAIFVHGCFWHRHPGCAKATTPKSRVEFWSSKFSANVERDDRNRRDLLARGWKVATIWECETRDETTLKAQLGDILGT